jgi:hypothetical protein
VRASRTSSVRELGRPPTVAQIADRDRDGVFDLL